MLLRGFTTSIFVSRRQCDRAVRASDLKSGEFKFRSDYLLSLLQEVPGSTPWLRLYIANWSASCHLGFSISLDSVVIFPAKM